jgi:hypothetical protein
MLATYCLLATSSFIAYSCMHPSFIAYATSSKTPSFSSIAFALPILCLAYAYAFGKAKQAMEEAPKGSLPCLGRGGVGASIALAIKHSPLI